VCGHGLVPAWYREEQVPCVAMALKRIKRELRELRLGDKPYVVLHPSDPPDPAQGDDGMFQWKVMMPGPPESP
jgi:ubiquitin-protein ligase